MILRRDFIVVGQDVDALQGRHVNQDAARDERADLLDAELLEPVASRRVSDLEAIVHAVADGLMGKAIELRAHLTDLADDQFLVASAAVRLRVHEGAFGMHIEAARAEKWHRGAEHMAEFDDLAGADQLRRPQHGLGLHMIAGTALVAGPHFDGQRSACVGTFQVCAWAMAPGARQARARTRVTRFMIAVSCKHQGPACAGPLWSG